ncbi:MAG: C45 family autoproteolytic acyltransferase/hydrolase [Planctomycetia bacterium]|nr:C45 family autoproteolytic acyltransferase/hydrolase [Planctomycetia bacterium]
MDKTPITTTKQQVTGPPGERNSIPYSLAVTGLACYLPGAESPEEFWQLLLDGKTRVAPVPESRFPSALFDPTKKRFGTSYTNLAALIDLEKFCRVTVPELAREYQTHRQQSLLPAAPGHLLPLFVALEAVKSAGLDPWNLTDRRIGVFNGLTLSNDSSAFQKNSRGAEFILDHLAHVPELAGKENGFADRIVRKFLETDVCVNNNILSNPMFFSQATPHHVARLIQESMQLTGMGYTFDCACSSSLLAFELARNYLREGKISRAIVGGTSWFTALDLVYFSKASAGSADGVWPFDARANGLVEGEGSVFAVVRGLEDAIRDGDPILGVIRGIGVASDGRGKSLWAPSVNGQALAIHRALLDSGYDSYNHCDYIEAHATSTQLGDATELEALKQEILPRIAANKKIPICSVKGVIGHMLEAAGAASLLKILLLMQHETLLPQSDFQSVSDKFDWQSAPFFVPQRRLPWPKNGKVRQAMVEAFGIGGLDAQMIVEGPEAAAEVKATDTASPAQHKDEHYNEPIAIIGTGCVLPGALGLEEFRARLHAGTPKFVPLPSDHKLPIYTRRDKQASDFDTRYRGGFVTDFHYNWRLHRIPPRHIETGDPLQFYVLAAVDEALDRAGYRSHLDKEGKENQKILDSDTTAVITGTRTFADFTLVQRAAFWHPVYEAKLRKILTEEGMTPTEAEQVVASFVKRLQAELPLLNDETGSQTISTLASRITKAYDLTGGALAMDNGDIASMTVLENAIQYLHNNRAIRTVICSAGNASMNKEEFDRCLAKGQVPGEGAVAFILKRLEDAQADGDSVLAVIRSCDCCRLDKDAADVLREKVKNQVKGLSKVAERPVFCESIAHDSPAKGHQWHDILTASLAGAGREASERRQEEAEDKTRAIFGDLRPAAGMVATLAAIERLKEQDHSLGFVSQIDEDNMFGSLVLEKEWSGVCSAMTAMSPSVQIGTTQKEENSHMNQDVSGPRKLVFMMPGQGSQYKGMLEHFRRNVPDAERIGRDLDTILQSLSFPSLDDLTITRGDLLGKDVFRTQLALLAGDVLMAKVLEERGVRADMVLGHSYGEYPAMVISGVWSFETAALATRRRCQAIEACLGCNGTAPSATTMLSTNATAEELDLLFNEITTQIGKGCLYASNLNSPDQTVISGTRPALELLVTALKKIKRVGIILPVPAAYHSPLVAKVCDPLRDAIAEIPFALPNIPMLSSVTMRYEADPDVFRNNLVEQLVQPVNFIAMIQKAYANGGRCFVEVGTKDVLSRLAKKILSEKEDVVFHVCDPGPGKNKTFDFDAVTAALCEYKSQTGTHAIAIGNAFSACKVSTIEKTNSLPQSVIADESSEDSHLCNSVDLTDLDTDWPVIVCSGTPREMGKQYGQSQAAAIRFALRRRAEIAGTPSEKLLYKPTSVDAFPDQAEEELQGIAEGAAVPLDLLRRLNVTVFPVTRQFVKHLTGVQTAGGGCSQFAGTLTDGNFVHGGNIDAPYIRIVPDSLDVALVVRRPENGIASVSIVPSGLLGSRGGINASGLSVSTCDLMNDDYAEPPVEGIRRGILMQRILDSCHNIEEAIALIKNSQLCGAKSLGLSELNTGRVALIENFGNSIRVETNRDQLVATNHSLLLKQDDVSSAPGHSQVRLQRLHQLLGESGELTRTTDDVFDVLRDTKDLTVDEQKHAPVSPWRTMNMVLRVDNLWSWMVDRETESLHLCRTISAVRNAIGSGTTCRIPLKRLLPELKSCPRNTRPAADICKLCQPTTAADSSTKCPQQPQQPGVALPDDGMIITVSQWQSQFESVPNDEQEHAARLTTRFANRLLRVDAKPHIENFNGEQILLVGGSRKLREQVKSQIEARNGRPVIVDVLDSNGSSRSEKEYEAAITEIFSREPVYRMIILRNGETNDLPISNTTNWNIMREQELVAPVLLLQQWYRLLLTRNELDKASIIIATFMDGLFGLSSDVQNVSGYAMTGLIRNMREESWMSHKNRPRIAAVDHAFGTDCSLVAWHLVNEMSNDESRWEDVGYANGSRWILRLVPEKLPPLESQANSSRPCTPQKREVWIITGGSRGVTAELAMAVGTHRHAKLHLIGSSTLATNPDWIHLDDAGLKELRKTVVREALERKEQPIQAWSKVERSIEATRSLCRFREQGIEIAYHACDLSNYTSAQELARDILKEEGCVDGILFGAGYEHSNLFEKTSLDNIRRTIDVKAGSAAAMLSVFDSKPPRILFGMGSMSGRFGSNGQVAYCMANCLLALTLAEFAQRHKESRARIIGWHAWDGVGMAVRPESKLALTLSGFKFMPVEEGKTLFLEEIENTTSSAPSYIETTATEASFYRNFYENVAPLPEQKDAQDPVTNSPQSEQPQAQNAPDDDHDHAKRKVSQTDLVVYGRNAEARAIRQAVGMSFDYEVSELPDASLALAAVFIVTSPRDPSVHKVNTPARVQYRRQQLQEILNELTRWRDARRPTAGDHSDTIILLTSDTTATNCLGYNENTEYKVAIEKLIACLPEHNRPILKIIAIADIVPPSLIAAIAASGELPPDQEESPTKMDAQIASETSVPELKRIETKPLFDHVECKSDLLLGSGLLYPGSDPFLVNHRFQKRPLLPFVVALELMLEIKTLAERRILNRPETDLVSMTNIKAIRGLHCLADTPHKFSCQLDMRPKTNSAFIRLLGELYNSDGNRTGDHYPLFSANTSFEASPQLEMPILPVGTPVQSWFQTYPGPDMLAFYHGPVLQNLQYCHILDAENFRGDIHVPAVQELFGSRTGLDDRILTDAAVLDACFWAVGVWNHANNPGKSVVPDSIACLTGRVGALRPESNCHVYIHHTGNIELPMNYRQRTYDFIILDEQEQPVYNVKGFRVTEIDSFPN